MRHNRSITEITMKIHRGQESLFVRCWCVIVTLSWRGRRHTHYCVSIEMHMRHNRSTTEITMKIHRGQECLFVRCWCVMVTLRWRGRRHTHYCVSLEMHMRHNRSISGTTMNIHRGQECLFVRCWCVIWLPYGEEMEGIPISCMSIDMYMSLPLKLCSTFVMWCRHLHDAH